MASSARRVLGLAFSLAAGCATSGHAARPGSGPAIAVGGEAMCRSIPGSNGKTTGLIPDAELCSDLVSALKEELHGAGYKIASADDPGAAAAATIIAHQTLARSGDRESPFLTVQVSIASAGHEVDRSAKDGNTTEAGGNKVQVRAFAKEIASDLARSAKMRAAGLAPGS
jgi:hypothetical protein